MMCEDKTKISVPQNGMFISNFVQRNQMEKTTWVSFFAWTPKDTAFPQTDKTCCIFQWCTSPLSTRRFLFYGETQRPAHISTKQRLIMKLQLLKEAFFLPSRLIIIVLTHWWVSSLLLLLQMEVPTDDRHPQSELSLSSEYFLNEVFRVYRSIFLDINSTSVEALIYT